MFLKTDGAGNLSFSSDLPTTSFTGATVETSIAGGDLVLVYDDSATAVRKMTRTNFVAGIGGTNTPAFRAQSNTDQSISSSVATKVNFATENYDTDNAFSSGTFTVPSGKNGIYQINTGLVCRSTSNNITTGNAQIYKNGSLLVSQYVSFETSQDLRNHFIGINTALELAVSDTIEIYLLIVATSPIISATEGGTFFNMYKIIQ